MKFEAKPTDLKLELTLLSGEKIVKDCVNNNLNAIQAAGITKAMAKHDKAIRDAQGDIAKVAKIIGGELSDIYGESVEWWTENLSFTILVEIKMWVLGQLSGIKKNVVS